MFSLNFVNINLYHFFTDLNIYILLAGLIKFAVFVLFIMINMLSNLLFVIISEFKPSKLPLFLSILFLPS